MWFHFRTSGHLKKNMFILTEKGINGFKSYRCFINKPSLKAQYVRNDHCQIQNKSGAVYN